MFTIHDTTFDTRLYQATLDFILVGWEQHVVSVEYVTENGAKDGWVEVYIKTEDVQLVGRLTDILCLSVDDVTDSNFVPQSHIDKRF